MSDSEGTVGAVKSVKSVESVRPAEVAKEAARREQVRESVADLIGRTPLVRLNRVARGVQATLLAKVEFLNPGGSLKDRIGFTMIEEAERSGQLRPGGTIVEATSGNTGVGLAMAAAVKGYRCVFVMPDKMSEEKIRLLRAFGARVVITPTAVEPDDPRSYYSVSRKIAEETPNSFYAGQYHNPANPEAHYRTTGPEIWEQTGGRVTVFVCGMGTGGTISGAGRCLKERNPAIKIVGADPVGSLYYEYFKTGQLGKAFTYKVEGIGEDFLPGTMDFSVVDEVIQVSDRESFLMARRLVREEGLLAGGSSGTAVAAALRYAMDLGPEDVIVVILPDSANRYLSKVFNDDWMRENRFLVSEWGEGTVADVLEAKPRREVITARVDDPMTAVVERMKRFDISQLPVTDEEGRYVGVVTEVDLLNHMLSGEHEHSPEEPIGPIVSTDAAVVGRNTSLEVLGEIFSRSSVTVVLEGDQVAGIVTKIDLIDFLTAKIK